MSAWQFQFGFVPSTSVTRHWADSHESIRILSPARERLWEGTAFPNSLVESLESLLPESRMVSDSHACWADGKGSHIDLKFERERVLNITVTLDLRVPCLSLVSDLSLLGNRQQWLAITTDGRVFRPIVRRFLAEIEQSSAMRWIRGSPEALARRHSARTSEELRCD